MIASIITDPTKLVTLPFVVARMAIEFTESILQVMV